MRADGKFLFRAAVAVTALALPTLYACGIAESVQSTKVLAATVLATPAYDVSKLVLPQGDGGTSLGDASIPDGGFGDAGSFLTGDGGIPTSVPAETVATIFFGERPQASPTGKPTGLTGATVKLAFGGKTFDLKDKGGGNYALSSLDEKTLQYVANQEYAYTISFKGETFTAKVTGPEKESIEQFKATGGAPLPQPANTKLELTRSSVENIAFTTVVPVTQDGKNGDPTYTDAPSQALDLLDLIANDGRWKQKVITIPGTAFPQKDTTYAVTVTSVKKGTTSDNLFLGSAFVAGVADIQVVKTNK